MARYFIRKIVRNVKQKEEPKEEVEVEPIKKKPIKQKVKITNDD